MKKTPVFGVFGLILPALMLVHGSGSAEDWSAGAEIRYRLFDK